MTPRPTTRLLLSALLILALAVPATAESSPEAQKWIDKLIAIYDQGPFQVDYEAELDMSALGQPLAGSLTGNLTQADRTHSRIEINLDMPNPPGMPEGGTSLSMLVVTDGETVWTEMDNPTLGSRQVTKASLEDLKKVGESQGGGIGITPGSMDPVAQLENLSQSLDFEIVEQGAGSVTLQGKITEKTRSNLGMLAAPGVNGFIFVIDEKTGFPTQVRADGENPFITMHFRNLKFVDKASLAESLFKYQPPPDVPVMDLGPMLKSQLKQ